LNDIKPKRKIGDLYDSDYSNSFSEHADGFSINALSYISPTVVVTASTSSQLKFWDLQDPSNKPAKILQE
jgi:hypothetical protein